MNRIRLCLTLLAVILSGCTFSRSGSQEIEVGPGYIRPVDAESKRIMRQATGDPGWGNEY